MTTRVENGKETFRSFPKEKRKQRAKKRKQKRYYAEKEGKRNILNGNGRGTARKFRKNKYQNFPEI
jgi:hypothetical protein